MSRLQLASVAQFAVVHFVVTISVLSPVPLARAQSASGTISGPVFDGSGRPLPNVKVTVVNEQNGNARATVTGQNGEYSIPFLPPGVYTVTVSAPGFADVTVIHVRIELNKMNVVLPPITLVPSSVGGPVTQQPGSGSPGTNPLEIQLLVNISDPARRGNFTDLQLSALPLGGASEMRSFDDLAFLVAGVAPPPFTPGVRGPGVGFGIGTAGEFSVNGARARSNNFTVDGSDNNDPDVGVRRQGFVTLVPQSIESIQEFQISTLLWDAQGGRNAGSQVNAVSRGGGKQVHGQAYGFFTDSRLNASNFFDHLGGASGGKDPLTRTQAGFVVGGPVAGNRTQLFGSFEHEKVNASKEHHFATPTLGERDFLGFLGSILGKTPTSFSVLHARPQSQRNFVFAANPGVGSTPLGNNILSLYPLPNDAGGPYGNNTYTAILPADGAGSVFSLRVNHRLIGSTTLSARYNFTDDNRVLPAINRAIGSTISSATRTQNLSLIADTALSATLYSQARFSYGRTRLEFPEYPNNPSRFQASSRVLIGGQAFSSQTGSIGELLIEPFSPVGLDDYTFPQGRVNNTFQYAEAISWNLSGHSFRFGTDIRRFQLNSFQDRLSRPLVVFGNGALAFGSFVVSGPTDPPPGRFVQESSTFLLPGVVLASLGLPSSVFQTITFSSPDSNIGLRFTEYNFFFNDNWRLRPNITFDYGVRYEYNTVPREVNGKIESALKLGNIPSPADSRLNSRERTSAFNAALDAYRSVLGNRSRIYDSDPNNAGLHFGFAWDPGSKGTSSIRAGYGIYYDTILGAVVSQSRSVFPNEIPVNVVLPFDVLNLNNPEFLQAGQPPVSLIRPGSGNQFGGSPQDFVPLIGQLLAQNLGGGGLAFVLPAKNLPTPYTQQWHLTFERELTAGYLVSAGYIGTKGTKLTRLTTPNLGPNVTTLVPVGLAIKAGSVTFPFGPAVDPDAARNLQQPRPIKSLGSIQVFENSANSTYHAFQLEARKRYTRGYHFTLAYTWSHALDDVSDVFPIAGASILPQDSFNLPLERGDASFDVRHRLAASLIWDLPFYRDSKSGAMARWAGGWQLASIFQASTGQPFTLNLPVDANLDGNLTDRPSTTDGLVFFSGHGRQKVAMALGRDVRAFFTPGRNGFVGRNTARGDSFVNLDLALNKNFRFTESQKLEIRTEFFNALNRANFGLPIRTLGSPGFGSAVDTVNPARNVQLAVKYSF
jgi:carboxypeptidase family protein